MYIYVGIIYVKKTMYTCKRYESEAYAYMSCRIVYYLFSVSRERLQARHSVCVRKRERERELRIGDVIVREKDITNKYEVNNCDFLRMKGEGVVSCMYHINYLFWCFERDEEQRMSVSTNEE